MYKQAMRDRLTLCLLGAWLMGSSMMFVVAPTNFHRIDELLAGSDNSSFRALAQRVGAVPTRELLRYLASELNRIFFLLWNIAQVGLGALVVGLSWQRPDERRARHLGLAAMLLVLLLLVVFTPLITAVGRSLDFVPREPPPPELARFKLLHVVYTALDLAKVGCLALATFWLVRAKRPLPEPSADERPA
jgi:hypothetical protein